MTKKAPFKALRYFLGFQCVKLPRNFRGGIRTVILAKNILNNIKKSGRMIWAKKKRISKILKSTSNRKRARRITWSTGMFLDQSGFNKYQIMESSSDKFIWVFLYKKIILHIFLRKKTVMTKYGQLLGYRITEHAEMYGSVICSTRKGMLTRLSATELTASILWRIPLVLRPGYQYTEGLTI